VGINGTRLLRKETVTLMTTNQLGDVPNTHGFRFGFKFGFGVTPETSDLHEQLKGTYNGGGAWSTSFRISPIGDWIIVTMTQVGWDNTLTPKWMTTYEKIAAEALEK
jgi:CubicO group peptidase (beta-lactamase class C family)